MFWAVRLTTTWARITSMKAVTASRSTFASTTFSCSRAALTELCASLTLLVVRKPRKIGCSTERVHATRHDSP